MPVEGRRLLIFGVNRERAHAGYISDLQGAAHGIEQQAGAQALALHRRVNRQTGQHQQRNRVTRHPLDDARRRIGMFDVAGDERIKSDDFRAVQRNVGLRGIRLLSLKRVTNKEAIKLRLTAGERLHGMLALELLDSEPCWRWSFSIRSPAALTVPL